MVLGTRSPFNGATLDVDAEAIKAALDNTSMEGAANIGVVQVGRDPHEKQAVPVHAPSAPAVGGAD